MDPNIAKGNATLGSVRDDTDNTDFRTCRDCHDPASPLKDPADLVVDNSVTGVTLGYPTSAFLSENPLDPGAVDGDTRWYPAFDWKGDQGVQRVFPTKLLLSAWWGDWQDNGTPGVLDAADLIKSIALWRVRYVTGGAPLGVVADDNADTKPEVNSEAEILAYVAALRGHDQHGNPVAARPVLVKGGRMWFDAGGGSLGSQDYHGTGAQGESSHPFSINHNVLPKAEAFGAATGGDCHRSLNGGQDTRVFDRRILVDPWDESGQPVYRTVREMTGPNPNQAPQPGTPTCRPCPRKGSPRTAAGARRRPPFFVARG